VKLWFHRAAGPAIALVVLGAAAFGIAPQPSISLHTDRMANLPRVVLWAWERREDLRFIDSRRVAIAYLDRTIELSGDKVIVHPRFAPLTAPAPTILIPVARIELDRRARPTFSIAQRARAARIIAAMGATAPPAIQIDFDATSSQRAFYRDLLTDVRDQLPRTTALSITALAAWCIDDDNWVAGLPVDEVVPMLYRMGPDAAAIKSYLRNGGDFAPARAHVSVGLSTDEPLMDATHGKRVYLFAPRPWTAAAVHDAIVQVMH
jgi:hypothetical protein